MNYDAILNHEKGLFEKSQDAVQSAFDKIFDENSGVGNSRMFSKVKNNIYEGNCEEITTYFANFDYDSFVSSKSLFASPHSFFTLDRDENNVYYVTFNDGYIHGDTSFATTAIMGIDANRQAVMDELCDAFNLSFTTEEKSNIQTFDYDTVYEAYVSYYNGTGYTYLNLFQNSTAKSYLKSALEDYGLTDSDVVKINNASIAALNKFSYYTEDTIKNALTMRLAFEYRYLSGGEHYKVIGRNLAYTGWFDENDITYEPEDRASRLMARRAFSHAFERAYLEIDGDPERKAAVSNLIEQIIAGYKKLAESYDWLDAKTRRGLNKKLEKMTFESCYSDKIKAYPEVDETNLSSMSVFDIYTRYQEWLLNIKTNNMFENNTLWYSMPSFTVNAFYMPNTNSFVILNGITSGLDFDGAFEEVLASIGTVIGHEMTHSIDSTGSLFDGDGNYVNWWSATTKQKFEESVDTLRTFYNQIGVTNSLAVQGNNVDGEATADMGGMHVCLDIAKSIEGFDYDLFFRTFANLWLIKEYNEYEISQRNTDTHPFEYLRVNVTLAQFEEFFETYNIKYGDKMYIPEEQRVTIW